METVLVAQQAAVQNAIDGLLVSERKLFDSDKSLSKFVESIDDMNEAIDYQALLDKDRFV